MSSKRGSLMSWLGADEQESADAPSAAWSPPTVAPRARRVSVPLVEAADIDEALEEPLVEKSKDSYDLVLVIRAKTGSAEWEDLLFRFSYAEVDYVVYERPRAGPKVRDEEADEPFESLPLRHMAALGIAA